MILAQGPVNSSCPLFRCASSSSNLGDGICISTYSQTFTGTNGANYTTAISDVDTSVCQTGISVCPPAQVSGKHACVPVPQGQNVDGEACNNNTKCFSGNCNNGVCKGIDIGAQCDASSECTIGYYCTGTNRSLDNSTCQKQLAAASNCSSRWDCVNNADCVNEVCTPLYSLPEQTVFTTSMLAHVCQSGFAYGGFCTGLTYQGATGDYITNGTDLKCNYTFTANYNQTIPHPEGACAYDGTFTQYCYFPGTNSALFQSMVTKLKNYYNGPALSKHTLRRDTYPYDIVLTVAQVNEWPKLINADKCTINLLAGTGSSGTLVKLSALVFGVLFLLF